MSIFESTAEAQVEYLAFLQRFLDSEDGIILAGALDAVEGPAILELSVWDPDAVFRLDLRERTVTAGAAKDATVRVGGTADELHNLLLDRLGPVEISRLIEERNLILEGPPPALAALLLVADSLHAHYAESLRERGRDDLLNTPLPILGEAWESAETPARRYGVRRPWQLSKREAAAASAS